MVKKTHFKSEKGSRYVDTPEDCPIEPPGRDSRQIEAQIKFESIGAGKDADGILKQKRQQNKSPTHELKRLHKPSRCSFFGRVPVRYGYRS